MLGKGYRSPTSSNMEHLFTVSTFRMHRKHLLFEPVTRLITFDLEMLNISPGFWKHLIMNNLNPFQICRLDNISCEKKLPGVFPNSFLNIATKALTLL